MIRTFATPLIRKQVGLGLPIWIASRAMSTSRYKVDDSIFSSPNVTKYSRALKILGSKRGDHKLTHRKSPEKRILAIDRKYQDKSGYSTLVDESYYLPPFVVYNKFKNPQLKEAMEEKEKEKEKVVVKKQVPTLSEKAKAFQQSMKSADLDRWVSTFVNRKRLPTAFELFHENQLQSATEEWGKLTKEEKQAFVKASQRSLKKKNYKPAFSFFLERYLVEIAKKWKEMSPLEKGPYQTRVYQARKRYEELYGSTKRHTIERPSFGLRSLFNAY